MNEFSFKNEMDELLKNGIKIAILKSILTLIQREINPTTKEIISEYQFLINEIEEGVDYALLISTNHQGKHLTTLVNADPQKLPPWMQK